MKSSIEGTPIDNKVVGITPAGNLKTQNFIDEEMNKFKLHHD